MTRRTLLLLGAPLLLPAQDTVAERWIAAGHWKRARAIVEERHRNTPNDPLSCFLLSQIRAAFGDRTAPMPLAERAVELDSRAAKYHRQVAEVAGMMAQNANAIRQLILARRFRREIEVTLALDSHDVQAYRDLVEFYLLAPGIAGGDRAKAQTTALKIGTIDPAEGYLAQARVAAFLKQTAEEESLLRRAVSSQPPSYRARLALAEFYLDPRHANPDRAEAASRSAVELDPGRADAHAALAVVYAGRSAWEQLDGALAEAARQASDDPFPYYRAAARLIADGHEWERARRYLRTYLAQEPEGNRPSSADAAALLRRVPK